MKRDTMPFKPHLLKEYDMANIANLSEEEIQSILNIIENPLVLSRKLLELHRDTTLSIFLPTKEIQKQTYFSYNLIKGKVCLDTGVKSFRNRIESFGNRIELDCFVAYGHWKRVGPFNENSIDIIERFDRFLPKIPIRKIGLFTCQNGIQNNLKDFEKMCASIISKLESEKPLFIGLYNPTSGKGYGIVEDLRRLMNEKTFNSQSFLFTRQMFATFLNLLGMINPRLLWTHIAHSEGGLIAKECLTDPILGLLCEDRQLAKTHLITLLYGGVAPIPDENAHQKINTYSNKDIALRLVKKYLDKLPMPDMTSQDRELSRISKEIHTFLSNMQGNKRNLTPETIFEQLRSGRDTHYNHFIKEYPHTSKKNGCTITVVDSIMKDLPLIEGDHAFIGDTYQRQLEANIKALRRDIKIYDSKKEF